MNEWLCEPCNLPVYKLNYHPYYIFLNFCISSLDLWLKTCERSMNDCKHESIRTLHSYMPMFSCVHSSTTPIIDFPMRGDQNNKLSNIIKAWIYDNSCVRIYSILVIVLLNACIGNLKSLASRPYEWHWSGLCVYGNGKFAWYKSWFIEIP